jgi:hypothetical protein
MLKLPPTINIQKSIFIMGFLSFLFGCVNKDNTTKKSIDSTDAKIISKDVEHMLPTKEQQERRTKSEAVCKAKNIPVYANPNALFLDAEENVRMRTTDEIVDRAIALCYLELKSEKADKDDLASFAKKYNVMAKLTAKEKKFAEEEKPSDQDMANANWRAESYHVMLWTLGYIDNLKYPNEICNVGDDVRILFSKTEKEFREKANCRTKTEILDEADLILRFDWACVNARTKNLPAPGELDSSIVYERHYSLNWLIHYLDQNWDDISTDT